MNSSTLTVQRKFFGHIFFLYAKKYKVYRIKPTVNFLPLGGDSEVRQVFTSAVLISAHSLGAVLLLTSTCTAVGQMTVGRASLIRGGDRYGTAQVDSTALTTFRNPAGGTSLSSRLSATWAAIRRCRSIIKLHFEQVHSLQGQYRLCPLRYAVWPWFLQRAQRGADTGRMTSCSIRKFSDMAAFFSFRIGALIIRHTSRLRQLRLKLLVLQFALFQLINVKQLIYHPRHFYCKWVLLFGMRMSRLMIGQSRLKLQLFHIIDWVPFITLVAVQVTKN